MKRILISWWAYQSDFIEKSNNVNRNDSPNYNFHKYFYNRQIEEKPGKAKLKGLTKNESLGATYDHHVLLSTANPDELSSPDHQKFVYLQQQLNFDFPTHTIKGVFVRINDLLDFKEIKTKMEEILLQYKDFEIDIFFSPGNSMMQISWLICHFSLKLNTRLLQMRPPKFTKDARPELLEINIEQSEFPFSVVLKDTSLNLRYSETCISETGYIGESLIPVYQKAEKGANTDKITVVIYGETGTGKELVARYIHDHSIRAKMPFEVVNCSALSETLLESVLFGYEKGAFTDAKEKKIGIFKLADRGTVFLDEIGDISPLMQQVLLRVLQEKKIRPIHGKEEAVDVRIIAATNKNLEKECEKGNFRWDLYYRLAGFELYLPPLRDWTLKDKEQLIHHLLQKKRKEFNKSFLLEISKKALEILLNYSFPGNIRQLEHLIESLYVIKDKDDFKVNEADISVKYKSPGDTRFTKWEDVEKLHILKILKLCKGNRRKANELIGYKSINTLYSKIKDYGIQGPDYLS